MLQGSLLLPVEYVVPAGCGCGDGRRWLPERGNMPDESRIFYLLPYQSGNAYARLWTLVKHAGITKKVSFHEWGSGVVEQVSLDLQAAFPESKGFSTTNLWRMKQWYQFYSNELKKLPQLAGELTASQKLAQLGREISDVPPSTNDFIAFPNYFAFVPWKHHVAIVSKCESVEEALFYVVKCINEGWSRNTLENFSEKLPSPQSEMAQEITKDTYDFGFLTLPDGYDEEKLETELEKQLTRFLLELGTGFAYLGRQKQIIVAGKTC